MATVKPGQAWELFFTTAARLTAAIEAELKARCKLSMPEYSVLLCASRAGQAGIRLGTLAHQVVFSPSRLTHTLKRLSDRGLIKRLPCESDRRGGLIALTDEGSTFFTEAANVHRVLVRRLALDGMTDDEIDQIMSFCTRVAGRLDAE
ncbi:MAG: MarR family transcriptional regulator [Actinomycetaceae bacterium]|nr:MarR family transcriptional regulator [Actinomycetaceae bacterium]